MESSNLNDFRPHNDEFEPDNGEETPLGTSTYKHDIHTLKIDKLSNRVTIISVILPCIIGAILVFAWFDMKERVIDTDVTTEKHYKEITLQLEEKLNAQNVKIAKNRFDLDSKLPQLEKNNTALQGQLAKITTDKADNAEIKAKFEKIDKKIENNANQDKTTLLTIERINRETLAAIAKNQEQFNASTKQIKENTDLFKEEFDARLLELSNYEQQIGELGKSVSLLDKKHKSLEQDLKSLAGLKQKIEALENSISTQLKTVEEQTRTLDQKITSSISNLEKQTNQIREKQADIAGQISKNNEKPKPQINIDSSGHSTIKEEPLEQ